MTCFCYRLLRKIPLIVPSLFISPSQTKNTPYPSMIYTLVPFKVMWSWHLSRLTLGERWASPWICHQPISGAICIDSHQLMYKLNLESPVNLARIFFILLLDTGAFSDNPCMHRENVHTQTEGK